MPGVETGSGADAGSERRLRKQKVRRHRLAGLARPVMDPVWGEPAWTLASFAPGGRVDGVACLAGVRMSSPQHASRRIRQILVEESTGRGALPDFVAATPSVLIDYVGDWLRLLDESRVVDLCWLGRLDRTLPASGAVAPRYDEPVRVAVTTLYDDLVYWSRLQRLPATVETGPGYPEWYHQALDPVYCTADRRRVGVLAQARGWTVWSVQQEQLFRLWLSLRTLVLVVEAGEASEYYPPGKDWWRDALTWVEGRLARAFGGTVT